VYLNAGGHRQHLVRAALSHFQQAAKKKEKRN